jgi:uncharacterized caspase-like protein
MQPVNCNRRRVIKGGVAAASLFLPLPYARVWAQSEGALKLLQVPKVALVLGNSNYRNVPALRNPANDANAIAEVLKGFGFDVTLKLNASRTEMETAIAAHTARLAQVNGVGVFYYAGHGLQLSWTNFLVPVDVAIRTAEAVQANCVDLSALMDGARNAANPMNIIILDACRVNPFEPNFRVPNKGLSQMDAPNDTLLAYATAPGNVAADGDGANGLYTESLLKEIRVPETRIEDVFKRVRLNVRHKSRGEQVPWESTSLEEDFWFLPPRQMTRIAEERTRKESETRTRAQAEAQRAAEMEAERKARAEARAKREREERESAESERKFKEELARWEGIKNSQNPEDFYAFLLERPSGYIAERAQFRLDQLEKPVVQAQPGANGIKPLPSGANRYALGDVFEWERIDGYTKIASRFVSRVTYADNDRVEFDGGATVLDQMGGILKNRFGTKTPAALIEPAELAVGKHWRIAYKNMWPGVVANNFYDFQVVGLEDVTVSAGTFKAYKVEGAGRSSYPGGGAYLSQMRWIDPATMISVRADLEFRTNGAMSMFEYSSTRLVSLRRAPR